MIPAVAQSPCVPSLFPPPPGCAWCRVAAAAESCAVMLDGRASVDRIWLARKRGGIDPRRSLRLRPPLVVIPSAVARSADAAQRRHLTRLVASLHCDKAGTMRDWDRQLTLGASLCARTDFPPRLTRAFGSSLPPLALAPLSCSLWPLPPCCPADAPPPPRRLPCRRRRGGDGYAAAADAAGSRWWDARQRHSDWCCSRCKCGRHSLRRRPRPHTRPV